MHRTQLETTVAVRIKRIKFTAIEKCCGQCCNKIDKEKDTIEWVQCGEYQEIAVGNLITGFMETRNQRKTQLSGSKRGEIQEIDGNLTIGLREKKNQRKTQLSD